MKTSKNKINYDIDSILIHENFFSYDFLTNYVLISNKDKLDNALIFSISENDFENFFNFKMFKNIGSLKLKNENDIIIGSKLAKSINVTLNDQIYLYNIDNL